MAEKPAVDFQAIQAIDGLNFPWYCTPELSNHIFSHEEFQLMLSTTFKAMRATPGEEWKAFGYKATPEEMFAEMDEAGFEKVVITDFKMWSYRRHLRLMVDIPIDVIQGIADKAPPGRIIKGVSYNPYRIEESLREIEKAVKEYGFKCCFMHPMTFGLAANDKKLYPCYAKCDELGIPVGFQVGHSAEVLPSEVGRPMYADEVALDFPNLTIILSHTGWPWIEEWVAMCWKHPNVYGDTAAYFPRGFEPGVVSFIDGRGRDKAILSTNGFGLKRNKEQVMQMQIREENKKRFLRDNALKAFKLE